MANISLAGKALPTLVMVAGLWIWYGINRQRDAEEAIELAGQVSPQDWTAGQLLCRAAKRGYRKVVERLLARGVHPDATPGLHDTSLLIAIQKGDKDLVRLLLSHGADVNAKTKTGSTPLHRAVSGRRKDLVRLLLKHGANTGTKTHGGRTPLDIALKSKQTGIVELLREHRPKPASGTRQNSAGQQTGEETAAPTQNSLTNPDS